MKILIIEDDHALQDAYSYLLKLKGHKVASAFDGKEGLKLARSSRYDVILLDLHMPVMDGIEFLKHYKKDLKPTTNVIVFSNMASQEIDKTVTALGASTTLLKSSMTPASLLSIIEAKVPTKNK